MIHNDYIILCFKKQCFIRNLQPKRKGASTIFPIYGFQNMSILKSNFINLLCYQDFVIGALVEPTKNVIEFLKKVFYEKYTKEKKILPN